MAEPDTPDEWFTLARQHEVTARAVVTSRVAAGQAMFHVGLAVECALKAYIMRKERLNGWPSRESRRDLYTHDLRQLLSASGLVIAHSDPIAPALSVILQWDRNQAYDPAPMPRKVARQWVESAFGPEGVNEWLRRACP